MVLESGTFDAFDPMTGYCLVVEHSAAHNTPNIHSAVSSYRVKLPSSDIVELSTIQHEEYERWSASAVNDSPLVHNSTRANLAALTQASKDD